MTDWNMELSEQNGTVKISENCGTNGHTVTFDKVDSETVEFRGTWPYMDWFTPSERHTELLAEHGYELA